MQIKDFRLGERGVSNDWAIKITLEGERYTMYLVLEDDCTREGIKYGDDAIENMYLDTFHAMRDNRTFVQFHNKWGSALKASDTVKQVLDNIAKNNGRTLLLNEEQLVLELERYVLGKPRYMWEDVERDLEWTRTLLNYTDEDEENKDWEQSAVEQPDEA